MSAMPWPRSRLPALLVVTACASAAHAPPREPMPIRGPEILGAARHGGGVRVRVALADSAYATVFAVVPGSSTQLLIPAAGSDATAVALAAGRHDLYLRPVPDALVAVPESRPAWNPPDPLSFDACMGELMKLAPLNAEQAAQLLDNPYRSCPERPSPAAGSSSAPQKYVLLVATSRPPDPTALRQQLTELDLTGSMAVLSQRVGRLVAHSGTADGDQPWLTAVSQW
jgi:hypothetical protein